MTYEAGFQTVRDFLWDITTEHPRSRFMSILNACFVEIDERPVQDLRVQFSYAGEGGGIRTIVEAAGVNHLTQTGQLTLGRISITGEVDFLPHLKRGWHVFDLLTDGTIDNFESPSRASSTSQKTLSDEEARSLGAWLEDNREEFWTH